MPPIETESTRDAGSAGTGSLAEELSAAFDAHALEANGGQPLETESQAAARRRDERGRFAAGEAAEADAGAGAAAGTEATAAPAKAATEAEPAAGAVEGTEAAPDAAAALTAGPKAPDNWSAVDKTRLAEVAKANPAAAQWMVDRHQAMVGDYTRKTQEIAAFRNEYQPIHDMFAPWQDRMKAAGFSPRTLIQAWAGVEKQLAEGKGVDVVRSLVTQYKLDPGQIAQALGLQGGATESGAAPAFDPRMVHDALAQSPFAQELQGLRTWAQSQEQARQQEAQARQDRALADINTQIDQFRGAFDKDGKTPLHPHFDEIEADMSRLAQVARARGEKPTLEQLYDSAVYANPSTRAKALAAATAAQQATTQAEARAKAASARRAGASVTGSPGSGQSPTAKPNKDMSLRDQLSAAFDDSLAD